jgi:hypothetical protein
MLAMQYDRHCYVDGYTAVASKLPPTENFI